MCASFSCARLLCEMALCGIAGTGSTSSSLTCFKLAIDADFLSGFPGAAKYPERWFGAGEVGEEATDEASVNVVSLEACEEARERVDTLWSESSADDWLRTVMDETFLRDEISGALYESMLVVETRAIGDEIWERSMLLLTLLKLWLRARVSMDSFGTSVRLMRLVIARARDILAD